jgi:putative SOS response-associated peptidase YedK
MCGRFTLKSPERVKLDHLSRSDLPLLPRYNIAPSQTVLALADFGNGPELAPLTWGLIPSWSNEANGSIKGTINARSETLDTKPSFSESFQRRRCLILADGFFEWKRTGKVKQPYYFQLNDESVFAFAGIWDRWRKDGLTINSCAIITTDANELLQPIHDRMPVILHSQLHKIWLDSRTAQTELKELLTPFPAAEMKSHPVSSAVNHTENDNPELVVRMDSEPGTTPSLF